MTEAWGPAKVHLCGGLTVELDGERVESRLRGRQGRQLFAHLVVNRNRTLTRDELIDAVWPFELPPRAGPALSTLLSQLRGVLGADAVQGRSEIQLVLPPESWVDLEAATEAIGRAESALARGDWQGAWSPANVARAIAERGFLPGYDAPWIDIRRRAVDDLLAQALECLAAVGVRLGGSELAAAERAAKRLVELAPLRESGHVALMEIQEARGNAAEGLRVYEDLRRLLSEELGTAPGSAAQELHMRLLDASSKSLRPRSAPAHTPARQPGAALPPLLEATPGGALVGRVRELERLDLALERTRDMPRQLVLVVGEPGIGKTRMLTEFGRRAHDWGASVLYGRGDEDRLVPYGPLQEALRQHVADAPPELVRRGAELGGEQLRGILPELAAAADVRPLAETDPALARYRLFDSFAALLMDAARERPVVLLLDDLQWADEPTLLLLKHVLRVPEKRHLLVVGTYRDAELHRATALLDTLADLQRNVPVDRVHLRGLARPDLAALAREIADGEAPESLVAFVHEETEGNPFFAIELVRHLATSGSDTPSGDRVPEGVREVIMRRLGRLPDRAQRTLRVAAVLGREFGLDVLEMVCEVQGEALIETIEEAEKAGIVAEVPGHGERYAFSHALVRRALYADLTATRRLRAHERIGHTLADLSRRGRAVPMAEIAGHLLAGLPRGDADEAIDFAARAAAEATELFGYEDAARHLARGIEALDQHRPDDVRRRAELMMELGHAQRRSGRMPEARATFLVAIEAARALGDNELLAAAVLGYGGGYFESAFLDETMVALLEEALAGLPSGDSSLRLELLSRLAKALYYSEEESDAQRREELSAEVIAMADRLGDPRAMLVALEGRHFALNRPENLDERLAAARLIVEQAREVGDRERDLLGRYFLISDLVEAADMERADAEIELYASLAEEARLPLHRWYATRFRAMRALLDGRCEDAAVLAMQAFELGNPVEPRTATMHFGAQMWVLQFFQGGLAGLEDAVRGFVAEYPRVAAWRIGLAHVLLAQGRSGEAAQVFAEFTDESFRNIPRDAIWGVSVGLAADLVARGLGGADEARALYEQMSPYSSRNAVTGETIVCLGPLSLYSGLMALVMGERDAAVRDLEDAFERSARMGSPPFEHAAAIALSGALAGRGAPGDAERARELAARADAVPQYLAGAVEGARRLCRDLVDVP